MPEQNESTLPARIIPQSVIVQHTFSLSELKGMADVFIAAKLFPDAKSAAQAVVKIMAGQELGFSPIESMMSVNVFAGRVTLSADAMAKLIKRSPQYDYKVVKLDDTICVLCFYQDGEAIGESIFSMDDAKKAKLTGKDVWQQYPRNMLFSRALSNGKRWYAPDAAPGVYTHEEMGLPVDAEGNAIMPAQIETMEPRDPRVRDIVQQMRPFIQAEQLAALSDLSDDIIANSNTDILNTVVMVCTSRIQSGTLADDQIKAIEVVRDAAASMLQELAPKED